MTLITLAVLMLGLAACFAWGLFPEWVEGRVDTLLERFEDER